MRRAWPAPLALAGALAGAFAGVLAASPGIARADDTLADDEAPADAPPAEAPPDGEPSPAEAPPPVDAPPPGTATPGGPVESASPVASAPPPVPGDTGFAFGSYGRVLAGSDLRGGTPERVAVVAHAPRIVEPSYLEADLYYRWVSPRGVRVRTVTTLAFADTLFHYTGRFDAQPALRNLFLEATLPQGLVVWGGSRMYRGDDIYLLDWWPLDDLNTVGAGLAWHRWPALRLDVHAGVNRLLDPFQYQEREVSDGGIGETTIVELDRQRLVASAAATHQRDLGPVHGKLKLYAEVQALPAGSRQIADGQGTSTQALGADRGLSLGAQLGLWDDAGSHANLFLRWSRGLTAFDDLQAPDGLDDDYTSWPGASELVAGLGGALARDRWHLLGGAYARRFVDADASVQDLDDGAEWAANLRPQVRLAGDLHLGLDLSYQVRLSRGVSPTTLLAADPAVAQVAPMLVYAPLGGGPFDRPQLRLVWRAATLNQAALDQYAPEDPRRAHATVHFLGVQAEWWFNSSTR